MAWKGVDRFALGALFALCGATAAEAATETDVLNVQVTVEADCSVTGGSLDFGEYVSGQADDLEVEGSIAYSGCAAGTLTIELDGGGNGDPNARAMNDGSGSLLVYQLHRNQSRTQIWGSGSDALQLQLVVPGGAAIPIYGTIPGNQAVPIGSYGDSVNVTMTF